MSYVQEVPIVPSYYVTTSFIVIVHIEENKKNGFLTQRQAHNDNAPKPQSAHHFSNSKRK